MTLISPTRGSMQQLLDVCAEYESKYCLKFNVSKSNVMVFGKASGMVKTVSPLLLGGDSLDFVTSTKYLGFHIVADLSFGLSVTEDLCKFYGAIYSVLTVLTKPKEQVLMMLLYTNCVLMLSYGAAIKDRVFTAKENHLFDVAVNNAVRRIFSFRRWQVFVNYVSSFIMIP